MANGAHANATGSEGGTVMPRIVEAVSDVRRPSVADAPRQWRYKAVIGAVLVSIAAGAGAQAAPPRYADEVRRMLQPHEDELRRSTLVGSDDELALATPDGELRPLTRGCVPPVTKGGLIKVDCTVSDGPAYYFDASTRAMIESCSFWFPDPKRCPPKQWPVDVPACDATIPDRINGTWRLYAIPGAGGFSPIDDGWTMTLTGESMTFVFSGRAPLERSYEVLERRDRRYSLEISDTRFAKTRIDVELAPCGLFVESEEICDAFCENFAAEVGVPTEQEIREVARRIAGERNGESLERMVTALRASIEQGPRPLFRERAFYTTAGVQ